MLISTLIESISLTQYDQVIYKTLWSSIAKSLEYLNQASINPKVDFKNYRALDKAIGKPLKDIMEMQISIDIGNALNKQSGEKIPGYDNIKFEKMTGSAGYASDTNVVLNVKYLDQLSNAIISSLYNIIIDSLSSEEDYESSYRYFLTKGKNDVITARAIENIIHDMTKTIVHEFVHTTQHHRQNIDGRLEHEYRSYLDKEKDQFRSLHGNTNRTPEQEKEYNRLFYASPQEMASFSHNIVQQIIKDFGFRDAEDYRELEAIEGDTIVYYVRQFLDQRDAPFYNGNAKEKAVFKRYIKSTYQELQRYLESLKQRFNKSN